jgi:hypothetical protein
MIFFNVLTLLFCALVCLFSLRDIRTNLLRFLIFAGYGIIHGLVPAVVPAELLNSHFSYESRSDAALFAFASVLALFSGWYLHEFSIRGRKRRINALKATLEHESVRSYLLPLFWVSMLIGTAGWAIYVKGTGASLQEMAQSSRFAFRQEGSTILKLAGTHLASFAFVPGFLCVFLERRHRIAGIVYTLAMALACFFVLTVGMRAIPLGLVGGIGVGYAMRYPVSPKRFVGLALGGVVIFCLAVSLYQVRKVMRESSAGEMVSQVFSPETYAAALTSDPLNYHENLVGAIDSFPSEHPYLAGATYCRILFFFLPNSNGDGLKPEDTNMVFARVVYHTNPTDLVAIPPSVPGDAYINWWGWWGGLAMMFLNGVILSWGNYKMLSKLFWFIVLGPQFARFALLVLRGQPYELFVTILFVAVVNWGLKKILDYALLATRKRKSQLRWTRDAPLQNMVEDVVHNGSTATPQLVTGMSMPLGIE